jgi:hypothetical protein
MLTYLRLFMPMLREHSGEKRQYGTFNFTVGNMASVPIQKRSLQAMKRCSNQPKDLSLCAAHNVEPDRG